MKTKKFTRQELKIFIEEKYRSYIRSELFDDKTRMLFKPEKVEKIMDELDSRGSGMFFYLDYERHEDDEVTVHVKGVNLIKNGEKYIYEEKE